MDNELIKLIKDNLIISIYSKVGNTVKFEDKGTHLEVFLNNEKDKKQVFNIENMAMRIQSDADFNIIIEQMSEIVYNCLKNISDYEVDYEYIKDRIYPLVRPQTFMQKYSQNNNEQNNLVHSLEIIRGLAVCYIYEVNNDQMVFITENMLQKWGIKQNKLHDTAIDNLRKIPFEEIKLSKQDNVLLISKLDSYDASRILILDYEKYEKRFKGQVMIGIPNRDMLIIYDSKSLACNVISQMIRVEYNSKPYSISQVSFKYHNKILTPMLF